MYVQCTICYSDNCLYMGTPVLESMIDVLASRTAVFHCGHFGL